MAAQPFDAAPHAQIVRSLFARTRRVMLYGPDGRLWWSEDGADALDLRTRLEQVLALMRQRDSPAALALARNADPATGLLLPVGEDGEPPLAWLGLIGPASRSASDPDGAALAQSLRPVLLLLAREVAGAAQLRRQRYASLQAAEQTAELRWLLATSSHAGRSAGADRLEATLDACAAHLGCDGVLLWLGDRQLERCVTRRSIPQPELETLRRLARGSLSQEVATRGRTTIVAKLRETPDSDLLPWTVIASPVVSGGEHHGLIMAFALRDSRRLTPRDARRLEHIIPRVLAATEIEHDPLTGLPARHVFEERLRTVLAAPGANVCVVYADLDQLHVTNDLFGFAAGDEVLRSVAALWRDHAGLHVEMASRFAGDRFVALLRDCTLNQGRVWAEAARQAVAALPPPPARSALRATASFGVAAAVTGESPEHVLAIAETACKAAKDRGRNRVEVFAQNDASLMQRRDDLQVFRDLTDAFAQNRFVLYAQPIESLWDPTRPRRHEILIRMRDLDGAPVSPSRFISAATRYQLLPQLDRWVVARAIEALDPHAEMLRARNVCFSINVSAQSLVQPDFADFVRTTLKGAAMPAELLVFEFTESAAISDIGAAQRFIERVGALGVHFALDDFGTGFSSLAYLKSLPVSALKIDGSFMRDLLTDDRSEGVVRAVLQIAAQLGLDTVAEYVESEAIADRLRALGVTYGQGYAFGAPVPLETVLAGLADSTPHSAPVHPTRVALHP
ncbi:MAG: putative bifunctional diguanylate cyclase/phosphodiesterase [Steroidobacteraceae bacterium]